MTLARVHLMCSRRAKVPVRRRERRVGRGVNAALLRSLREAQQQRREQRELFWGMRHDVKLCRMKPREAALFLYAALRAVALGEQVWEVPMLDFCLDAGEYLFEDPDDVMRLYMRLEKKGVFANPAKFYQRARQLELPFEGEGNG